MVLGTVLDESLVWAKTYLNILPPGKNKKPQTQKF